MKRILIAGVSVLFLGLTFWGCEQKSDAAPLNITRLESDIFAVKSPADMTAFLQKNPFFKAYLGAGADIPDSLVAQQLYANVNNPQLRAFQQDLVQQFGDLAAIKPALEQAFGEINRNFPQFKAPRVMTAVTGFLGHDLYVMDSLIIIGLDYFGGPKAKYRPQVYDYQLRRYQAEYIVPSILFLLSNKYNKIKPDDNTLLADMTWYGKGFEFVKHIAPDTPDTLIIAYSQQQLDDVYASQSDIWAYFLDRRLLYQTRDAEKERFIGERPATVEISQYCPGAIARWVGWRIVSQYVAQKPNLKLRDLMATDNARLLLEESKYRGQRDDE